VKRTGRGEPIWVVIHICMVITLGISLYSYLYVKPAKTLLISYVFSSTKLENRFCPEGGGVGRGLGGWGEVEVGRGGPNNVKTIK
jgi:hypothetical protein